ARRRGSRRGTRAGAPRPARPSAGARSRGRVEPRPLPRGGSRRREGRGWSSPIPAGPGSRRFHPQVMTEVPPGGARTLSLRRSSRDQIVGALLEVVVLTVEIVVPLPILQLPGLAPGAGELAGVLGRCPRGIGAEAVGE